MYHPTESKKERKEKRGESRVKGTASISMRYAHRTNGLEQRKGMSCGRNRGRRFERVHMATSGWMPYTSCRPC